MLALSSGYSQELSHNSSVQARNLIYFSNETVTFGVVAQLKDKIENVLFLVCVDIFS